MIADSHVSPAPPTSRKALVRAAVDLGARGVKGRSDQENALVERALSAPRTERVVLDDLRERILRLEDPLGEAWLAIKAVAQRRNTGSFYTDPHLVPPMIAWLRAQGITRLVDAGCGSGRFAARAVAAEPDLKVVAIDTDPVATLIARAVLAVLGARDATVLNEDYLDCVLPAHRGTTGYVSNPPYVRQQRLSRRIKTRGQEMADAVDHSVSGLAGLHTYFFLATRQQARPGDVGCFLTSSEWIENVYGGTVRGLLLDGLGGESVRIVDTRPFEFAKVQTTAAITCFRVGVEATGLRIGSVLNAAELQDLRALDNVPFYTREFLAACDDWKPASRNPQGEFGMHETLTIGDLFRVKRGTATGANAFFVLDDEESRERGLTRWCVPVLSTAKELPNARENLLATDVRRKLLVVPNNVDRERHPALDRYLSEGEAGDKPLCDRNLTAARRIWWSFVPETPPIIVSYMARKAPRFYANRDRVATLNIAHGLHPKRNLTIAETRDVVRALNAAAEGYLNWARTYHGNLKKFEPREVERLPLPLDLVPLVEGT